MNRSNLKRMSLKQRVDRLEELLPRQKRRARIAWLAVIDGRPAKIGYDNGHSEPYRGQPIPQVGVKLYGFDPTKAI